MQLASFTNCNIPACFKGYLSESSVILSTNSVLKCTSASVVDFRYANNFSQTVSTFEAFVMWQRRSNVCKEITKRCIKYTKCSQVIVIIILVSKMYSTFLSRIPAVSYYISFLLFWLAQQALGSSGRKRERAHARETREGYLSPRVSPSRAPVVFLCPLLPSTCYAGYFFLRDMNQLLPTYPSPKPTLSLTSHLAQNVGLGEG